MAYPHREGSSTQQIISDLVNRYVHVLDRKEIEAWPDFFLETASYSVYSRENYESGLPIAFELDDSRDRIEDRVAIIRKVWAEHVNEFQPRHIVSNIIIEEEDVGDDVVFSQSNFALYATEAEGSTSLLAVGEYRDRILVADGKAKFEEKKVILDTNLLPRPFVYPI